MVPVGAVVWIWFHPVVCVQLHLCALKLEKNTLFISVSDFSALVAITVTSCFGSLLLLCCSDCHSGCLDAVALALAFASQHLVFLFLF